MTDNDPLKIYVALVHFPVLNKVGEIVTSSVTTLDVHDIARICRTYAVDTFYVVTPLDTQRRLVERIVEHWMKGFGAEYNPSRKEALTSVVVKNVLQEVVEDIESNCGQTPRMVIPDATRFPKSIDYPDMRQAMIRTGGPHLLAFGTGWGLEPGLVERADYVLAPIDGINGYNHLPVRAATAIILDRLLGPAKGPEI